MGLMVHSLAEFPENVKRNDYIYLLDFGWEEPLSKIIHDNYSKIAAFTSQNNAVFITGAHGCHVDNEILSWHHINGERGEDILPALLITTENPHVFYQMGELSRTSDRNSKIVLVPLKRYCKTSSDVITLIKQIFNDIQDGTELINFEVRKEMKNGVLKRLFDGVILEPNISGIGFNLKKFFRKS